MNAIRRALLGTIYNSLLIYPAIAGTVAPPAKSATAQLQTAPRTNLYTYFQAWSLGTLAAGTYLNGAGGHAFIYAIELEDDYSAIRLLFGNATASAYTVGQVTVSPSSEWGLTPNAGVTPYDVSGTALTTMIPVSFNSAGADSAPFPAAGNGYSASVQGGPEAILSLATSASASAGATTLSFGSTFTGAATGSAAPAVGWIVSDGLGCIAPGTTISAITSTVVTLSAAVQSPGCVSGQSVYFSRSALTLTGLTVPGTANAPSPTIVMSDWIPVSSIPRIDGGIIAGMTVTGSPSIPAGTLTTLPVLPQSFGISNALTGSMGGNSVLTLSLVYPATAAVPGGFIIPLSSVVGLHTGMKVTGISGLTGAVIQQVCSSALCATPLGGSSYVRLSALIPPGITSGQNLTFSITANVASNGTAGQTAVSVASTSNKRLLLVRGYISSGAPTIISMGNNQSSLETSRYGLPLSLFTEGPQSGGAAVDCVNFVPLCGTVGPGTYSFSGSPIYGVNYIGRHRGVQVAAVGDSHMGGTSTGSGIANYVRLSTNALSSLDLPVSVENVAIGGNQGQQFFPLLSKFLQITKPSIAVLQGITGNGADWSGSYETQMQGIANYVLSYGGRVIYTTDYPRQSRVITNVVVAAPGVANSTTIPLTILLPDNNIGTITVALSGAGVPAGTTAAVTRYQTSITASVPLTLAAGTLLSFAVIPATTTSGNNSLTLSQPSYTGGTATVTGANIPAGCTGVIAVNNTGVGMTCNATASGATTVTLGGWTPPGVLVTQEAGIGNVTAMLGNRQATTLFDSFSILEDPADPGYFLRQYTLDGLHADDAGHAVLAVPFTNLLQQMIGN
jgi:hypothetical protein